MLFNTLKGAKIDCDDVDGDVHDDVDGDVHVHVHAHV